jgi:predicted LPLAT superfamily acyltransferase
VTWTAQPERGSAWLTRSAWFLARHGGWSVGRALTFPATLWFLLGSPRARAASREFLSRALGRPAGLRDVARHFDHFACAVLDRLLLLSGAAASYKIRTEGLEQFLDVVGRGRGAILLGAHLGSFEVLRTLAATSPVPVWALMYRRNTGALTALLDELAPHLRLRVLEIGDTASMIQAKECIERGEIVGILADRAPPGHRDVPTPFLGGVASFPSGPWVLASLLGAPVFLFYAVSTGRRAYRAVIEPFAERVVLRRESRMADLQTYVGSYAASLEQACRAAPLEWFNFFPFWENADAPPEAARPPAAARRLAGRQSG